MIVPFFHFRSPNHTAAVWKILYATECQLFSSWDRQIGFCLTVSHAQPTAVSVLAESHEYVGHVQILDGVGFVHFLNGGIPLLTLRQVHDEIGKDKTHAGTRHGGAESQDGTTKILEVVNLVYLVNDLL